MDAATLQKKIYSGYGKAAKRIGKFATLSRATSATIPPLDTIFDNRLVSFTQNFEYSKFNKYGVAIWTAIFDGTDIQPGDYMCTEDGTWFIAAMQPLLPIMAVECNRIIDVVRVSQSDSFGAIGYSGDTPETEEPVMCGWPCSILQGTKGEKNPNQLPGDERTPWWVILLPAYECVTLKTSDIIKDDLGRRYVISSPELTDLGWRITASMQVP